jgi:hypothetical protein
MVGRTFIGRDRHPATEAYARLHCAIAGAPLLIDPHRPE